MPTKLTTQLRPMLVKAWPGLAAFVVAMALSGAVSYSIETSQVEHRALRAQVDTLQFRLAVPQPYRRANVATDFNPEVHAPIVDSSAYLDPTSSVLGQVELGSHVFVAPFASIRADVGLPIHVGSRSSVQDGAVIHALPTVDRGVPLQQRSYRVNDHEYGVYIGERVSLAPQALVHGPARVDHDVYVGMRALIFRSHIGAGSVVEPGAVVQGVTVPPGRIVPAGSTITRQGQADSLAVMTAAHPYHGVNDAAVHVSATLAEQYLVVRQAVESEWAKKLAPEPEPEKAPKPKKKASSGAH